MNEELKPWIPTIASAIGGVLLLFVFGTLGGGDAPAQEAPPVSQPETEAPPPPIASVTPSDSPLASPSPTVADLPESPTPEAPPPPPPAPPPAGGGGSDRPDGYVIPSSASATNSARTIETRGRTIAYGPDLAVDGVKDTAWCVPGNGIGEMLELRFAFPLKISAVSFIPGYDKIDPDTGDDRFEENRKILAVRVSFNTATPYEIVLTGELRQYHIITLPRPIKTNRVWIEPLETSGPSRSDRNYTCVSEAGVISG